MLFVLDILVGFEDKIKADFLVTLSFNSDYKDETKRAEQTKVHRIEFNTWEDPIKILTNKLETCIEFTHPKVERINEIWRKRYNTYTYEV